MSTHNVCFHGQIRKIDEFWLKSAGAVTIRFGLCWVFNDTSTLEGHFVSSPIEREKRDRRDSRGNERKRQERKRKMNESKETEEIKTVPSTLTCCEVTCRKPCPTVSQYQLDAPVMQDT